MYKQNYTDVNSKTWDKWAENGCEWSQLMRHEEYIKVKIGRWGVYLTPAERECYKISIVIGVKYAIIYAKKVK